MMRIRGDRFLRPPDRAWAAARVGRQVGTVVSVQGTALVERAGKPARILGAGEALEQKDVINVAQGSHAVLEFTRQDARHAAAEHRVPRRELLGRPGAGPGHGARSCPKAAFAQ